MAENTELQEAKGLLSKMVTFLSGDKVEATEEESKTEEKAELMEGSLEVGEYMLPNGKKLIVTEEGAEIEAEPAEESPEGEAEMTKEEDEEKTEMASEKPQGLAELSLGEMAKTIEKLVESNEALSEKIVNLEAAKPLRGAPTREKKEKKHVTPNMSLAQAAAIRLENAGL